LRDIRLSEAAHFLFACFLLFQHLPLAQDVPGVTLRPVCTAELAFEP